MVTVYPSPLKEVLIIEPRVFHDDRGFFFETYQEKAYHEAGLRRAFVQDNQSHSKQGVLRGLHYQLKHPQAKLIYVVQGKIFDVAVDIREGSPSFGKWTGLCLSADNHRQLFVPEGFAHGFCVLSEVADVIYKCTDFYCPGDEYGLRWDDPELAIEWPLKHPILSEKDAAAPLIRHQRQRGCLPQLPETLHDAALTANPAENRAQPCN